MSGKLPRGSGKDNSDYRPLTPRAIQSLEQLPGAFTQFADDVRNSFSLLTNKFLPMLERHDQRIEASENETRDNTERIRLAEIETKRNADETKRNTDRIAALEKALLEK